MDGVITVVFIGLGKLWIGSVACVDAKTRIYEYKQQCLVVYM